MHKSRSVHSETLLDQRKILITKLISRQLQQSMSSHLIGCKVRENYSVIASYLKIFRSCKDYWQRIGTLLGGIWRWKKKRVFW